MFTIERPTDSCLQDWLDARRECAVTYSPVGATNGNRPSGFRKDHTRAQVGSGRHCYEAAIQAIRNWRQFELGWLEVRPAGTPLQAGDCVAVVAYSLGLWSANPARILYLVDSSGPPAQFGFAYGTLPGHIARGEERFLVEWNPSDDSVWFDILAYSRPCHPLGWIGYPWLRHMQKRFGRESVAAMRRAVAGA